MKIIFIISLVFVLLSCKDVIDDVSINPTIHTNESHFKYQSSIAMLDSTFIPQQYALNQNYPNPFNIHTTIQFSIPVESLVRIIVLDSFNNEVATLIDKKLLPGYYSIMFSSDDLENGIYYYKITTNEFDDIKEMLVIKNH